MEKAKPYQLYDSNAYSPMEKAKPYQLYDSNF